VALARSRATQCLGVQLGHPVSGGHIYRAMVLHVGCWARGCQILPVKHRLSLKLNNKRWRPDTVLFSINHTKISKLCYVEFWQPCCWILKYFRILGYVDWQIATYVSKDYISFLCRVKQFQFYYLAAGIWRWKAMRSFETSVVIYQEWNGRTESFNTEIL
jgi:hypothetical protein